MRQLRKLQKKGLELEPVENDDSNHIQAKKSVFLMLDNESNEEIPPTSSEPELAPETRASKPKKKKKKGKKQQTQQEDDWDDSLFENIPKYEIPEPIMAQPKDMFTIDYKKLNGDLELVRQFGSVALNDKSSNPKPRKRMILPPKTWPVWNKGLSMDMNMVNDTPIFTFRHSKFYMQFQFQFLQSVETFNPNLFMELLREFPYHVDSLIQMSNVYKHQGDFAMAAEFVERALYSFESGFHHKFNILNGTCLLDFDRVENRPMFACLLKHVEYLSKRSCPETAFEYLKILFNLDPKTDPVGTVLLMDYYALKAERYSWYLEFYDTFKDRFSLDKLPNAVFSSALATWHLEEKDKSDHKKSSEIMAKAVSQFPFLAVELSEKLSIDYNSKLGNTV